MSQFLKKIMGSGSDDQKDQNKASVSPKKDENQSQPVAPKNTQPKPANAAPKASMPEKEQPSSASFSAPRRPAPFTTDGQNCTTIGSDVAVTGTLAFSEKAVINGKFSGQIKSKGALYIGNEGKVQSDLNIGSCVVEGSLVGNINAQGKVELRSKSSLKGDIKADKLRIEEGVVFRGHCCVGADAAEEKAVPAAPAAAPVVQEPAKPAPVAAPAPAASDKVEEKKEEKKD